MINTLLGVKVAMEARYDGSNRRLAVTRLQLMPNTVIAIKTGRAVLGAGLKKKVKNPQKGLVAAFGFAPQFIREAKAEGEVKVGEKISVGIFSAQDLVKVTGTTKGKGFAGVVKRWGFAGGPKTHGQSDRHRAPGSIGQTTTPGRVYKGKKMAGRLGNFKKTIRNLEVIEVDQEKNLLFVKGSLPGAANSWVLVEKIGKAKTYVAPPVEKSKEENEKDQKPPDSPDKVSHEQEGKQ